MQRSRLLKLMDRTDQEGSVMLDLSKKGLTVLPPEIGRLTNLKYLYLAKNQLKTLPAEISQLTNLRFLDLSDNQLQILPAEIGRLLQLRGLNLSANQLRELPVEICQLSRLQELYLGRNRITSLPSEIFQLTQLHYLNIGGNGLTALLSEVLSLTQLQTLNLGGNKLISLPVEVVHLPMLRSLNLAGNQWTVLSPEVGRLGELPHLQKLYLDHNKLKLLPPEIGQLSQLEYLNLSENLLLALPPEIGQLMQLTTLNLKRNQLTTIPVTIGELTQLKRLNLSENQLKELPEEIKKLTQLQSLDLRINNLTMLPPGIGKLSQLQKLRARLNQLRTVPSQIGNLSQLKVLDLRANRLRALPHEIGHLTQLEELKLHKNKLTALPPEIGSCIHLKELDLRRNEVMELPSEIGQLVQVRDLNLRGNQLTILPSGIGSLIRLRDLNLSGNQLTALPPEIGNLTRLSSFYLANNKLAALPQEIGELSRLTTLDLRDNPLPIAPEILARFKDPQTIIDTYVDFLAGQSHPLNEVKMVLVGQGSVGKTSLVTCLLDGPVAFDPYETKTEGINIRRWQLPLHQSNDPRFSKSTNIRVNVWDFGGQEIMHATHQFFLTRRTLYLLVLDTRLSEAENRLDYWLRIIRSFGGDSPIIIVGNKLDQQPLDIDKAGIKDKYPAIKAIVETSCSTGTGIETLQAAIAKQVLIIPHVFDQLLASWFDIKAQLEELDADYIPYAKYAEMCINAGITNSRSQRTLLGFLHDLGIVLHFPDPRLETTNILNPEWVTQGVYRILNTHALFQNGGVLTRELLAQILEGPKYPRDKHMFIVDMMRKFELCYPFPGREHTYLVPDLLPKEERYTGKWDDALAFQVHYDVLPGSVFSRFIVRMHRCIHQHTVWRTGVLLALDGNEALVRADLTNNRIFIRVRGPASGRRDLLSRIREQFAAIHHTIQGLQAEEKVPLPGHPELPPVDYKHLRNLEGADIEKWIPEGLTEPINVKRLLNGVESPSARRRDSEGNPATEYKIYGSRIDHIGDVTTQSEERSRQMDPITGAIISALSAGVAGGVTDVGKKVIVDAYNALKAAIKKKQGEDSDVVEAVEKLEEKPESEGRQTMLAEEVADAKLTKDKILVKQAQELIAVLKESAAGQQALGKYNIQAVDSEIGVIGDDAHIEGGIKFNR